MKCRNCENGYWVRGLSSVCIAWTKKLTRTKKADSDNILTEFSNSRVSSAAAQIRKV